MESFLRSVVKYLYDEMIGRKKREGMVNGLILLTRTFRHQVVLIRTGGRTNSTVELVCPMCLKSVSVGSV